MTINTTPKKARHLSFDVETAIKYGVDESIMIQNFIFWIEKNLANGRNHHDGRTWTYNTQEAFTVLFPFWTHRQIRRVIDSLINQDVLITGNYNKAGFDQTLWYAFKHQSEWLNIPDNPPLSLEDIELTKTSNAIDQNVSPIPDTTTDLKTDLKTNNNALDEMVFSSSPVQLSLSLVGLTEKQNYEASLKLSTLSPTQRDLAIQAFNKTVSAGAVKSSPMALLNKLVNLGLENAIESPQAAKPMLPLPQIKKTPEMTLEQRENTRLELLKALVMRKKADFLTEFNQKGFVSTNAFGTVIEPDLRAAGLFD